MMARGALVRWERDRELAAWVVVSAVNAAGVRESPLRMDELLGPEYLVRLAEREAARAAGESSEESA